MPPSAQRCTLCLMRSGGVVRGSRGNRGSRGSRSSRGSRGRRREDG